MVTVLNGSRSLILHNDCFGLQRHDGGGWVTVTSTHGIVVPCPPVGGVPQPAGARGAERVASGELVFESNWSYLSAIRGRFTATDAPVLAGSPSPTGTVMTLVVNARTAA